MYLTLSDPGGTKWQDPFHIAIAIFLVRASAWLNTWSCSPACLSACLFQLAYCLKDQAPNCLIHFGGSWGAAREQKMTFTGRRPSMEDDLRWKTTFDGRQPLMEDDIWWKTTYDERRPMMEDGLWWKTTYDGRRLIMEEDLWWKITYD